MNKTQSEPTDIFLWANNNDGVKNELDIELFLFSKNYVPYSVTVSSELDAQIRPLFLYDVIGQVVLGAGTGMAVKDYELSEGEENTVLYTDVEKVTNAQALINLIEHQRHEVVIFAEEEHEMKRMKGVIARFTHKDKPGEAFYIAKQVMTSQLLSGAATWQFKGGKFESFAADVGWKVPADSQVLIVGGDVFIFNQSKFEKLFGYDYKKQLLADKKVAEIESKYKLSFPDGLDLQSLVRERKKVASKLNKLEVGAITQEQALEYADTMQLELMSDDDGSIIIMDGNDLDMFINLINEDYITSEITGKRYEIKSKKLLDDPEGEPPRGTL